MAPTIKFRIAKRREIKRRIHAQRHGFRRPSLEAWALKWLDAESLTRELLDSLLLRARRGAAGVGDERCLLDSCIRVDNALKILERLLCAIEQQIQPLFETVNRFGRQDEIHPSWVDGFERFMHRLTDAKPV